MRNHSVISTFLLPVLLLFLSGCISEEPNYDEDYYLSDSKNKLGINTDILPSEDSPFDWESDFIVPDLIVESQSFLEKRKTIKDNINNTEWNYSVILPPSYYSEEYKKYPVLYLFHGLGNSDLTWINNLKIKEKYDYCLYHDLIEEIIIIMPDARKTYYVNDYQDNIQYETFFFSTFLPFIEEEYRIQTQNKRFISGFSMGGYGAAYYAYKYNDYFEYCYAMSAPLNGKGTPLTPSIIDIVTNKNKDDLPFMTMDIAKRDDFFNSNLVLHNKFMAMNLDHELIFREGAHNTDFWNGSSLACLLRIGRILKNSYYR